VNQLVLMRMLEKLGHSPLLAVDGNEAVARWQEERPDLILMDYRMPGLDGPAATRLIREREAAGSRVPIIAVTANALAEQRESCLAAGMDDYLSKPVTLQQLALAIDRYR
jgi:CheY-like chemotaxis protein